MRTLKHLSPSALGLWESDRELFYMKYLAEDRESQPQNLPAAVGSAFDAMVKSGINHDLRINDPEYTFDALFEKQVEPQCRDFAVEAGDHCWRAYLHCGAYDDLLRELQSAHDVAFEYRLEKEVEGVPVIGYPDLTYKSRSGPHSTIFDWKVNGYCSKHATSPAKLYRLVRDGQEGKPSRNAGRPHKGFKPLNWETVTVGAHSLEEAKKDWADQLATYAWLAGIPIGSEFVARIDQIVAKPAEPKPLLRIANHCAMISREYQSQIVKRYQDCWNAVQSGHIFEELPLDESQEKCELLDMMLATKGDDSLAALDYTSGRGWKS